MLVTSLPVLTADCVPCSTGVTTRLFPRKDLFVDGSCERAHSTCALCYHLPPFCSGSPLARIAVMPGALTGTFRSTSRHAACSSAVLGVRGSQCRPVAAAPAVAVAQQPQQRQSSSEEAQAQLDDLVAKLDSSAQATDDDIVAAYASTLREFRRCAVP